MVSERLFDNRAEMIAALQAECESALRAAIDDRSEATFMVSGGSTPEPLYKALSNSDLDWESVYVALVDERWVDFDHDKSNEAFTVKHLIQNKAAVANLVGMKNTAETAAEGLADCEAAYQQLAQPFDITILGMGSDGHTASLFPYAQGLDEALNPESNELCAAITAQQSEVTGAIVERMTLSLAGLLRSKVLILLITGDEKLAVLRAAQADGDVKEMPIRAVLRQQQVPVVVYWAP
ncbi:6-phosphogluconolactonase [Cellvibrio sp. KY-GH-1]|uniref:6-phosphogluconolactonase n=1 Tax=Cellvibrio sp. KY-GH-1 TaxID=2303332 RepID=UPI0012452E8D|nr:6-phosphogluconolactonase [Cellvibrio sp. KY-GH-1]QEY16105.1 6-phosphogluconolactonase [Cellvibrio sp. KY-GH-1]